MVSIINPDIREREGSFESFQRDSDSENNYINKDEDRNSKFSIDREQLTVKLNLTN